MSDSVVRQIIEDNFKEEVLDAARKVWKDRKKLLLKNPLFLTAERAAQDKLAGWLRNLFTELFADKPRSTKHKIIHRLAGAALDRISWHYLARCCLEKVQNETSSRS